MSNTTRISSDLALMVKLWFDSKFRKILTKLGELPPQRTLSFDVLELELVMKVSGIDRAEREKERDFELKQIDADYHEDIIQVHNALLEMDELNKQVGSHILSVLKSNFASTDKEVVLSRFRALCLAKLIA